MVEREELLQALAIVEASPDYRLLRRLVPRERYHNLTDEPVYSGLVLDLEATGADALTADVIEFGAARFTFDANGVIYSIDERVGWLQQPPAPIPAHITDITGITDDDVAGQSIPIQGVAEIVSGADLVIAFNADYDRRLAERTWPGLFETKKWACAYRQVPWELYGVIGRKLHHVVTAAGLFFEAHRAVADCEAVVHLLATMSRELPEDFDIPEPDGAFAAEIEAGVWSAARTSPMGDLLETTKAGAFRVLAWGSAIEDKDKLKVRGYRWTGREPWFVDLSSIEEARLERDWLRANVPCEPGLVRISARDRYSVREDVLTWG